MDTQVGGRSTVRLDTVEVVVKKKYNGGEYEPFTCDCVSVGLTGL